jgi:hypothetical protein
MTRGLAEQARAGDGLQPTLRCAPLRLSAAPDAWRWAAGRSVVAWRARRKSRSGRTAPGPRPGVPVLHTATQPGARPTAGAVPGGRRTAPRATPVVPGALTGGACGPSTVLGRRGGSRPWQRRVSGVRPCWRPHPGGGPAACPRHRAHGRGVVGWCATRCGGRRGVSWRASGAGRPAQRRWPGGRPG